MYWFGYSVSELLSCMLISVMFVFFFFFKQKTAYEMRISDWSSDVCSSDLTDRLYKKAVELLKRKNAVRRLARAEGRQLTEDERLVTLITPAAVRVFEQLTTLARTCAGKVFPTWEWIEAASGLSRASEIGRANV